VRERKDMRERKRQRVRKKGQEKRGKPKATAIDARDERDKRELSANLGHHKKRLFAEVVAQVKHLNAEVQAPALTPEKPFFDEKNMFF